MLTGAITPAEMRDRIARLSGAVGPFAPQEDPEAFLAQLHMVLGEPAPAAQRLGRLYQRAVEHGDEMSQAALSGLLAQAELGAGNWRRARRLADEVTKAAGHIATVRSFGADLYSTALVEAHLGNVDPARVAATALVELAERRGLVPLLLQGRAVLGFVALSSGDARGAHAQLGAVVDGLRLLGVREWGVVHLVWSDLDALVELGELDQADALASEMWSRGHAMGRGLELAAAERGRGLVLAARGDFGAAQAALERSLVEHERLGCPFERARTLLAMGVVLRRGKQKRTARENLQRALAVFDQLGARLWSVRTSRELARIGGRAPAAGSLTATQRRVAHLVADGSSNREVADQLFLSVKTVAAHLTSVYAKLGVRSRAELARYLRDNDLPHSDR